MIPKILLFILNQNQNISADENQILNDFPDLQGIITGTGESFPHIVQRVQVVQTYRND